MAPTRADDEAIAVATGPVLFAYDGSELAEFAIEQDGWAVHIRPARRSTAGE